MPLFSHKNKNEEDMPKKIEDIVTNTNTNDNITIIPPDTTNINPKVDILNEPPTKEITNDSNEVLDDNIIDDTIQEDKIEIPDSLINDPQAVGYNDAESQNQFYELAIAGLDLNEQHILDMGCGRGDLLNFLSKKINEFDYTGYEINSLLCKAFDTKYNDLNNDKVKIINANWFEAEKDELVYDYVFNILSLSTNYDGYTEDKWDYLLKTIDLAVRKCQKAAIFILLSDNGGIVEYTHFPIPELIEKIQDKYMFAIDRTTAMTIYKLGIIK